MSWVFADNLPIYTQLVEQLTQRIITGVYSPGGKLPSVRELAAEAAVNPNTVQRAFGALEQSGLIFTLRTSGKYVTTDEAAILEAKRQTATERSLAYLTAMDAIGYGQEETIGLLRQLAEETKKEEKQLEEENHGNSAM